MQTTEYQPNTLYQGVTNIWIFKYFSDTNIWLCHRSTLYLLGTEIDWLEDTMGNRFIFTNPNADSSCGCGKTFNIIK